MQACQRSEQTHESHLYYSFLGECNLFGQLRQISTKEDARGVRVHGVRVRGVRARALIMTGTLRCPPAVVRSVHVCTGRRSLQLAAVLPFLVGGGAIFLFIQDPVARN